MSGKVALVTGGLHRVGATIAARLAREGYRLALHGRSEGAPDAALAQALAETGVAAQIFTADLADAAAVAALVPQVAAHFGRAPDVLVNNAGITQPLKVMDIGPGNYDAVLDVNLRGTLYASQAAIPQMRSQKSGSIVNISSVSAQRGGGIFGGPHYSAAKAGVLGLTKAMARELAPDGVRVNAICPGFIATDITAGKMTDEMMATVLAGIPMGRAGEARDVAGCALFLASDLAAYVTGSEVDVNGGSLIH